jgi:hypothetical protein
MKSSGQWLADSGQQRVDGGEWTVVSGEIGGATSALSGRIQPDQTCAAQSGQIQPNPTKSNLLRMNGVVSGQWTVLSGEGGGRLRPNRAESNRIKPARPTQAKSNQIQPNQTSSEGEGNNLLVLFSPRFSCKGAPRLAGSARPNRWRGPRRSPWRDRPVEAIQKR